MLRKRNRPTLSNDTLIRILVNKPTQHDERAALAWQVAFARWDEAQGTPEEQPRGRGNSGKVFLDAECRDCGRLIRLIRVYRRLGICAGCARVRQARRRARET